MNIFKYNYFEQKISTIAIDSSNRSIWIAFEKNFSNICKLIKVDIYEPASILFTMNFIVDKIVKIKDNGYYLLLAVNSTSLIGKVLYSYNTSLVADINMPSGVIENAIDLDYDSNYIYFLCPGNISGENTKIIKTTLIGALEEVIDLPTINNAVSMVYKDNNLWVVTKESPNSRLVRVYNPGSGYVYDSYDLISII